MKKLQFLTLALFALAGVASADDQQLQNLKDIQRAQASQRTETVAVYAGGRALSQTYAAPQGVDTRYEVRTNAHGQTSGGYVPNK